MKNFIKSFENPSVYTLYLILIILSALSYWTYLYFSTDMVIAHDAIGYEEAGRRVFQEGWKGYFTSGTHREPLYIFTIAFSMKMGEIVGLHYHHFQKLIQVMLLFSTQLLMVYLLGKLRLPNFFKLAAVFYFGISPAIVNGALSLYSEIIAYPFVLLSIILLTKSWPAMIHRDLSAAIRLAVLTGVCLLLLVLGKGVFRFVALAALLPFVAVLMQAAWRRRWPVAKRSVIYLIITTVILFGGVTGLKILIGKYSGEAAYTERYNFILLGSAIKRSRPLTKETVLAHLATIPGRGVCDKFFSDETCTNAEWFGSIDGTYAESERLLADVPPEQRHKAMFGIALDLIKKEPLQFAFFSVVEALRIFFWESTQIGFVDYPEWLQQLFANTAVRYSFRFIVSLLTLLGVGYLLIHVLSQYRLLIDPAAVQEAEAAAVMIFIFITVFTAIYATCYVLTRYSLPVASLFLIAIALMGQRIQKNLCD